MSLTINDDASVEKFKRKSVSTRAKIKKECISSLKRFKTLYKEAPFPYQSLSLDGKILTVNSKWLDMLEYEESEVIGKDFLTFIDKEDFENYKNSYSLFIQRKEMHNVELRLISKSNKVVFVKINGILSKVNSQDETHCILQDITYKKQYEKELKLALVVFENTNEGILVTDKNNNILSVNRAFTKVTQYTKKDVIGKTPRILKSNKHDNDFYIYMWEHLDKYDTWTGEIYNRRKNGEVYPQWLNISVIRDKNNEIENYIALFSDISRLKESESKVSYLKHNDTLTELPNRTLLNLRLKKLMTDSYKDYSNLAVLCINIDNLKNINDSFGYHVGDEVIITLAKRLKKVLKSKDIVARISSDEFVVVLEKVGQFNTVLSVINRIQNEVKKDIRIVDHLISITSCIGVSIYPNHGINVNDLLKHAETALHNAKKLGKSQYQFYNEYMTEEVIGKVKIEKEINDAIKNDEFEVYFQPQVDIHSKKIIGAEALVRWNHKEKGILTPDKFLDYLEVSENIIPVGEKILKDACTFFNELHEEGLLLDGKVAVNLSAVQINNSKIVNTIKQTLKDTGLNPKNLELEVVETSILQDTKRTISLFEQLKDLDVKLAIDDFGTGYSSLSYIKQFPIDKLKIDKSFVMDVTKNKKDKAIVETIVALGKGLDLKVIAEGVETSSQENYLKENTKCDEVQGWLYSKALNKEAFKEFVKQYI